MRKRPDNWSTKRLTKTTWTGLKRSETGQIFFGRPKKNEKKTEQLVDQETDQNHMDGTIDQKFPETEQIFFGSTKKREK